MEQKGDSPSGLSPLKQKQSKRGKMKTKHSYPAIFDYAEDGISIEFPDLPGCLSCADTEEEAIKMAKEALNLWTKELEKNKDQLPPASKKRKNKISSQTKNNSNRNINNKSPSQLAKYFLIQRLLS